MKPCFLRQSFSSLPVTCFTSDSESVSSRLHIALNTGNTYRKYCYSDSRQSAIQVNQCHFQLYSSVKFCIFVRFLYFLLAFFVV
ncbi:unnamed protein product [Clavelina lepadiformis]|uniref:Uncharacterized protein n=1 Tax=Clavelina lepadiformis TaxID=159417 RepID=A0ABP0FKW4_CLALP